VTRRFRDVVYHIDVKNPNNVQKGVVSMTVDGNPIDVNPTMGCIIPFESGKTDVNVTVVMG
jgi:cellobiose phosphorylase